MMPDADDRAMCKRLESRLFDMTIIAEAVREANRFIGERPAIIYTHNNEDGPFMMEVHIVGYGECDAMAGFGDDDGDGVLVEVR